MKTICTSSLIDFVVVTTRMVTTDETDQFGHLNFGDMQKMIIRERINGVESHLGITRLSMQHDGIFFIVGEHYTKIHRQAFAGEKLLFLSWVEVIREKHMNVRCIVLRDRDSQPAKMIALSMFSLCCVDSEGRTREIPARITIESCDLEPARSAARALGSANVDFKSQQWCRLARATQLDLALLY